MKAGEGIPKACVDVLEVLSTALAMEEQGREFYEKAASSCKNDVGADLFRTLAKDEIRHAAVLKDLHRSVEACGRFTDRPRDDGGDRVDVEVFFAEMAGKHRDAMECQAGDIDAVEVGIDMELKAITFYMQRLGRTSDPAERKFLHAIIAEERNHHAALTDMRFYLTNPGAYFAEKERAGFDGA